MKQKSMYFLTLLHYLQYLSYRKQYHNVPYYLAVNIFTLKEVSKGRKVHCMKNNSIIIVINIISHLRYFS